MTRLAGKVAIVLGAAGEGNMGQVIARRYALEGAKVIVAGRHVDVLERLVNEIGGDAITCDITEKKQIQAMANFALERHGRLDIAINCTGWGLLGRFTETTEDDLVKMMNLQFKGPFQWLQVMVAAMSNGGSIIQISSATATLLIENHAAYVGTKAGIDHVVRAVANEYGKHGIRVNSLSPGITETPMTAEHMAIPGLRQAFEKEYPLGRIGTSEDIAAAAVFLASDECFMTGQNLQINGGLTLRRNPTNKEIAASVAAQSSKGA